MTATAATASPAARYTPSRRTNASACWNATAVEVYPPQSEVVDDADMYHLWIVERLPFSLFHWERDA